jgi:cobalamin biosynthesis protein CobT
MERNTIIARQSKTTDNYAVYNAAEPENPEEGFKRALEGLYIEKDAFTELEEPPTFIRVNLGDDEPLTLSNKKSTATTRSFESAASIDGSPIVCSLYVAHRLYDEEVPEELSLSIDTSATDSDWDEAVDAVEEEFGVSADADEGTPDFIESDESDAESDENDSEEDELSEEEQELQAVVQSAE